MNSVLPATDETQRRRMILMLTTTGLATLSLVVGLLAEQGLQGTNAPTIGPLELRLAYNTGVSFNLGDMLPTWLIVILTASLTGGLFIYAWKIVPQAHFVLRVAAAAVLSGALANLIDRTIDGRVTDYFHTGWFPTFNLPDVFITCGAALIAALSLRQSSSKSSEDDQYEERHREIT